MEEFHRGQKYQFLIDNYPILFTVGNRGYEIRQYVYELSEEEINVKCDELCHEKLPVYDFIKIKKYRYYNKSFELLSGKEWSNKFYLGRCYQFLDDSGNSSSLCLHDEDLIKSAEHLWGIILKKKAATKKETTNSKAKEKEKPAKSTKKKSEKEKE